MVVTSPTTTESFSTHFKVPSVVTPLPSDIGGFMNSNSRPLQLLGAGAGGGMLAVGILCFLDIFSAFRNPLTYVLNIFYLLFGAALLLTSIFSTSAASQMIYSQCNFLTNPKGRAFFYLFLGCLMTASGSGAHVSWLYLVVGIYLLLLSLLSLTVALRK